MMFACLSALYQSIENPMSNENIRPKESCIYRRERKITNNFDLKSMQHFKNRLRATFLMVKDHWSLKCLIFDWISQCSSIYLVQINLQHFILCRSHVTASFVIDSFESSLWRNTDKRLPCSWKYSRLVSVFSSILVDQVHSISLKLTYAIHFRSISKRQLHNCLPLGLPSSWRVAQFQPIIRNNCTFP